MRSLVQPKGLSLSGDNNAVGHVVRKHLGLESKLNPSAVDVADSLIDSRIRIPPRCTMNSAGVFVAEEEKLDLEKRWPKHYLSDHHYHAGDFIAQQSGIDKKTEVVQHFLKRAA